MRVILLMFALLAGCATQPAPKPVPLAAGEIRSANAAQSGLAIGKTTKADVRAALGEGTMVNFDSGYEVWVYRQPALEQTKTPAGELVLLFEPSGILAKTRVR